MVRKGYGNDHKDDLWDFKSAEWTILEQLPLISTIIYERAAQDFYVPAVRTSCEKVLLLLKWAGTYCISAGLQEHMHLEPTILPRLPQLRRSSRIMLSVVHYMDPFPTRSGSIIT